MLLAVTAAAGDGGFDTQAAQLSAALREHFTSLSAALREHFARRGYLDSLGYCCHRAGHHEQAVAFYQQALGVYADVGERYFRAQTLMRLGETHRVSGNVAAARDLWQEALSILDGLQHPGADLARGKLAGKMAGGGLPMATSS